ncbi:hypothetical protein [Halorussus caseinilyticus]|uniref:Right-handed parallel beta-helix repeat-containing protein n=1 Tax=Halorussus caseinilyticus TaxID=3034025 RepID=A0ABD5WI28_9EURY|nr:hypothetical protein [Halorussus sp. DT72]
MSPRPLPVVALATLVLLAGVGPVGETGPVGEDGTSAAVAANVPTDRADASIDRTDATADRAAVPVERAAAPIRRSADAFQYKVSLNNVTIETWLLRDSKVVNATIESVVVRNATTENGSRTNVTLSNVTVGRFALERARLKNVTARKLVVRNKSVLDIPGGGFIDPNVENRTLERHWTRNTTVSGVVIDRMAVDAAVLCENATLGQRASNPTAFDPTASDDKPAITVENGTVGEALVIRGEATGWSVESVQQPDPTSSSLPDGCGRG